MFLLMRIETLSLSELLPDINNARVHTSENIEAIKKSINRFGQLKPLIVRDGTNDILIGNGRYRALIDLGEKEALCVIVELTDKQANVLRVIDNRTTDLSEWNKQLLIEGIVDLPMELVECIGFDKEYIDDLRNVQLNNNDLSENPSQGYVCPCCGNEF